MLKIFTGLLVLTLFMSELFAYSFPGGNGSAENPYQIKTAEDLNAVREYLGQSKSGIHFRMMNDINLAEYSAGWAPIGGKFIGYFYGNFDGRGFTIKNLYINAVDEAGLFANNKGTIHDLRIEASVSGNICVGALAGANDGTIFNCGSSGTITAKQFSAGGLIGLNYGSISSSYSTCTVTAQEQAGGFVGTAYGSIRNCYAAGAVSATQYVGGFVGSPNGGNISFCYSSASVSGNMYKNSVGAFSGSYLDGFVSNLYNRETCGNTRLNQTGMASGITSGQMRDRATFTALKWDYLYESANGTEDIWGNNPTANNGFPVLAWQGYGDIPFSGTGTSENPYLIAAFDQLNMVRFFMTPGLCFKLANDIDCSPTLGAASKNCWVPIGLTNQKPNTDGYNNNAQGFTAFNGTLDGAGFTIKNLSTSYSGEYHALFGIIGDAGVVKNLKLDASCSIQGSHALGSIAGHSNGTIENCQSSAALIYDGGIAHVGGIAGFSGGTIKNSAFAGTIRSSSTTLINNRLGGIAGALGGTGSIVNCTNSAALTGNAETGGIAGFYGSSARIDSCKNTGIIIGSENVGGIAGITASGRITNCTNNSAVTGTSKTGGITGFFVTSIRIDSCRNTGNITGTEYVGGIAGYVDTGVISSNTVEIAHCWNGGDVSVTNQYGGGIAGAVVKMSWCNIRDCFNTGNISGKKTGTTVLGGILGHGALFDDRVAPIPGRGYEIVIEKCWSSGSVSGTASQQNGMVVGSCNRGVKVKNCYFLDPNVNGTLPGIADFPTANSAMITITKVTSPEVMQTPSTFETFDFTDTWVTDPSKKVMNGYPYLKYLGAPYSIVCPSNYSKTYGDLPFKIEASSVSGREITFTSTKPEAASVNSKGEVTILSSGTAEIVLHIKDFEGNAFAADGIVTITIEKATPRITTVSPITYGQKLSAAAVTGSVSGTAVFTAGETVPTAGTTPYELTFTPLDTNFKTIKTAVPVTVNRAPSEVSFESVSTTFGTPLSSGMLKVKSSVPGKFGFTDSTTLRNAGTHQTEVFFIPSDLNFSPMNKTITLTVLPKPVTVTLGNLTHTYNGSAVSLGAITTTVFVDGTPQNVPVKLEYWGAEGPVEAAPVRSGKYAVKAAVTAPNYTGSKIDTVRIAKAPLILSIDTLKAVYNGAAKTVPVKGVPQNSTVSFTYGSPENSAPSAAGTYPVRAVISDTNYLTTSADGWIVISPANLTVTANNQKKSVSDPDPIYTSTITGWVNGENESVLTKQPTAAAVHSGTAGSYPIIVSGAESKNYTFTYVNGTLTILDPVGIFNGGAVTMKNAENGIAVINNPVTGDRAEIAVFTPAGAEIRLVILDPLGNLLDEQRGVTISTGEPHKFVWNLCGRDNQPVSSGSYAAAAVVKMPDGSMRKYKTLIGVQR